MAEYQIAIPSYRRSKILRERTLAYLERTNVDPSRIKIFVADKHELEDYRRELEGKPYEIVVGIKGMAHIRNFIQTYYPEGTNLLQLDDDIKKLLEKISDKEAREIYDLETLIQQGFDACRRAGTKLWGIYPVKNPYFMKHGTTFDLKYIEGSFIGTVVDHDPDLFVDLSGKEDWQRSILYFRRFGSVVRFNGYSMDADFRGLPGGCTEADGRTLETQKAECESLVRRYPGYCVINTARTKTPEIRLTPNPKVRRPV